MADFPAIRLHSEGVEGGRQYMVVSIQVGTAWIEIIREGVANVGGTVSHIIEPRGIGKRIGEYLTRKEPHPHG